MNELTCKKCNDVTILCDEGVVSVTCSVCVMIDVVNWTEPHAVEVENDEEFNFLLNNGDEYYPGGLNVK